MFNKILLPWYRDIIYNGIDISGSWFNEQKFQNLLKQECTFNIEQKAEKLCVTMSIIKISIDGTTETKIFKLKGYIKERFVLLQGENIDRKKIGIISFLLQVERDGCLLKGVDSWYDVGTSSIRSSETSLMRKN